MKKILSYILISFVIFTNLFAPFSVILNQGNNVEIKSNKAEADAGIKVTNTVSYTNTTISGEVRVVWGNTGWRTNNQGVTVLLLDSSSNTVLYNQPITLVGAPKPWLPSETGADGVQTGSFKFTVLPSTTYEVQSVASQNLLDWWSASVGVAGGVIGGTIGSIAGPLGTVAGAALGSVLATPNATPAGTTISTPLIITTNAAVNTTVNQAAPQISVNTDALLPTCSIWSSDTYGGCVGVILYWLIFKPTSFIFALSGKLLDITVDYSTKDTSYRSPFVVQGWGVIRDFCNMFFIFVMLYIAISTILSIHGFNTKQMIINVVIIGLFINFSLFATQVIIDASNIMTRVFYNSNTIAIGPMKDGVIQDQRGTDGEIKLSEALVAKINPQKLILQAAMSDNIPTTLDAGSDTKTQSNGVTASTFIIICVMASVVNIVGLLTFLSSSLIFVSRVVGLWLAMIFAPLAFFSYIVPQLQDIKMVGWKKWWPDTINMAFLAPVFVFFMYIIIKFLNTGLGIIQNDKASGMDFILGIIIPFIFIMILLLRAKSVAKDMSGEIGQSITNGIAAVGGLALGGAALGAAFLGRKTIGSVAKYVQNDSARQKDTKTFGGYKDWSMGKKLNPFAYIGQAGKTAMAGVAAGIHNIPGGKDSSGNKQTLGERLKNSEKIMGEKTHSDQVIKSKMDEMHFDKDAKYKDLSETEQTKVKDSIDKDELAKYIYGKSFDKLDSIGSSNIENRFTNDNERVVENKNGKKGILDKNLLVTYKDPILGTEAFDKDEHTKESDVFEHHAGAKGVDTAMGEFSMALRRGSMDIRNISQLSSKSKGLPMMGVGLAALVASGVRMGLKSGPGIDHGVGQKDFLKDIGSTITSALKEVKVVAPKAPSGGGGGGHDAHGGGGGHH